MSYDKSQHYLKLRSHKQKRGSLPAKWSKILRESVVYVRFQMFPTDSVWKNINWNASKVKVPPKNVSLFEISNNFKIVILYKF